MARRFTRLSIDGVKDAQRLKYGLDKLMSDAESRLTDIEDVLAQVVAAQAAADAAQSTANTANTTASTAKKQNAISASWTVPGTVLTATDTGSDVTVSVAAHVRHYDDGTTVSVNSHNFTGKAYGTAYAVYYDDPTRADTTPSYQITTNMATAQANQADGRHRVGALTTPTAGGAPTSGTSSPPGSSVGGPDYIQP